MATHPTKVTAEPGKQELFITREMDFPRELVFKAFIDPKLLIQWLGPKNMTMKIDKFEGKTGGSYRYIHTDKDGNAYAFRGVFHDITAPERAIQTFEFELIPGHVILDAAKFEELPGNRTRINIHSVFQSVEDRDGMVQSGMESGMSEGYARLEELLAKM